MFKELILDNTNEGDIVFDPCAGGMTTVIAALETDRKFICCEKDRETFIKSRDWFFNNYNKEIRWNE